MTMSGCCANGLHERCEYEECTCSCHEGLRYQVRCALSEYGQAFEVVDTHTPGQVPIAHEFLTRTAAEQSARQLNEVLEEVEAERLGRAA